MEAHNRGENKAEPTNEEMIETFPEELKNKVKALKQKMLEFDSYNKTLKEDTPAKEAVFQEILEKMRKEMKEAEKLYEEVKQRTAKQITQLDRDQTLSSAERSQQQDVFFLEKEKADKQFEKTKNEIEQKFWQLKTKADIFCKDVERDSGQFIKEIEKLKKEMGEEIEKYKKQIKTNKVYDKLLEKLKDGAYLN